VDGAQGYDINLDVLETEGREAVFLRFRQSPFDTSEDGDDFVVVLVFERTGAVAPATSHVMILSRRVHLAELAEHFKTLKHRICGQHTCSNDQAGV
jgi:hypothetical protein